MEVRALLAEQLAEAKKGPQFQKRMAALYEQQRHGKLQSIPYDYETYMQLRSAYPRGEKAFVAALGQRHATGNAVNQTQLHAAFQQMKQRELAEDWWANSHPAVLIQHHAEGEADVIASKVGEQVSDFVKMLLDLPAQLATVLLLSFFIMVDFSSLRKGFLKLKDSRLSFLYDELFPGIAQLGNLIGKAFYAQAIVSLINALLTYIALIFLGISNPLLLSLIVFVFSFVPVIGVILSAIPISLMAIVQLGGQSGWPCTQLGQFP